MVKLTITKLTAHHRQADGMQLCYRVNDAWTVLWSCIQAHSIYAASVVMNVYFHDAISPNWRIWTWRAWRMPGRWPDGVPTLWTLLRRMHAYLTWPAFSQLSRETKLHRIKLHLQIFPGRAKTHALWLCPNLVQHPKGDTANDQIRRMNQLTQD